MAMIAASADWTPLAFYTQASPGSRGRPIDVHTRVEP
jgi:hypothetical protein